MPLTIDEIANHNLVKCRLGNSLYDASKIMLEHYVGSVLVEDQDGNIVGIITKNDILRQVVARKDLFVTMAGDVMSHPIASCERTDTIDEALRKFGHYRRLAVKNADGKIIGIVRKRIAESTFHVSLAYDFVKQHIHKPSLPGEGLF